MGSFSLSSKNLFLRSSGKNRIMVVKLTKDVHSSMVENKDWEIVEIIGKNSSFESLEIFGHKIRGQALKRLAINLCESRLWVNMEGNNFVRLGITSLTLNVVFYLTNELFDWAEFGVKKLSPDSASNDKDYDDMSLEDLKNELKAKEDEIKKLKEGSNNEEDATNKKTAKQLKDEKEKVTHLEQEAKKTAKQLKDEKEKVTHLEQEAKKTAKQLKNEKEKATHLEQEIQKKNEEIKTLEENIKEAKEIAKQDLIKSTEEKKNELEKKDEEIASLKKTISSLSSSSSSSTPPAVTNYDQILRRWKRPVLPNRFNTVSYNNSYYYSPPDFLSMPTYRPVDERVYGIYPRGMSVYVSEGSFDKNNWWFIKIRDENGNYESFFAFYGGVEGSRAVTYGGRTVDVSLPYPGYAVFTSNIQFLVVAMRGYGAVFGFRY